MTTYRIGNHVCILLGMVEARSVNVKNTTTKCLLPVFIVRFFVGIQSYIVRVYCLYVSVVRAPRPSSTHSNKTVCARALSTSPIVFVPSVSGSLVSSRGSTVVPRTA